MGIRTHKTFEALTDRQRATIIKMHKEGYTLKMIGQRFSVSSETIRNYLEREGALDNSKPNRHYWMTEHS